MSAPQISTDTLIRSINHIIDQARNDMREIVRISKTRSVTDDEIEEYEFLARTVKHQTIQRDKLLAQ